MTAPFCVGRKGKKMKVISVINLKGGVGKTTTAVNMAAIMAREHGKRVALIDCDPQANMTAFFNRKGQLNNVASLLREGGSVSRYICATSIPEVDLIPGDISLVMEDISALSRADGHDAVLQLDMACSALDSQGYDYVIIDCPPCFSAASVAAICASTEVLIPVKLDAFAMDGVAELRYQIGALRSIRPALAYGILITMWHNVEVVREGMKVFLERYGDHVFRTYIRRTDKVDESTYARQTLDIWSPTSSAGKDYRAFVAEYLGGDCHG